MRTLDCGGTEVLRSPSSAGRRTVADEVPSALRGSRTDEPLPAGSAWASAPETWWTTPGCPVAAIAGWTKGRSGLVRRALPSGANGEPAVERGPLGRDGVITVER
jgi:hypothetical protein